MYLIFPNAPFSILLIQAAEHGNADAVERLNALSQPVAQPLSRKEHELITETQLTRKRTQAKARGAAVNATAGEGGAPSLPLPSGFRGEAAPSAAAYDNRIVENVRHNSLAHLGSAHPHRTATEGPRHSDPRYSVPVAPTQRYSLADPGGLGANPGVRKGSGARPTSSPGPVEIDSSRPLSVATAATSTSPPPSNGLTLPKRPATFAEMGIQGVKAEDKDCVIM
jgi:hypothetical protein